METIGQRIAQLRKAKSWSLAELGRQMAHATGRAKPFRGETIRLYEQGANKPSVAARQALAKVFERSEIYIEFGTTGEDRSKTARQATADDVISDAALEIARAFDQLSIECQQHVHRQIELLRGTEANHRNRQKAARHDVEIKRGVIRSRKRSKIDKGVR